MNGNAYYVITERHKETGRTFSYARTVARNNNLVGLFVPSAGCELLHINNTATLKDAKETADDWNGCAIRNGNYMFQKAPQGAMVV